MLFSLYPSLTKKAFRIRYLFHCKKVSIYGDQNYQDGPQKCCGGRLIQQQAPEEEQRDQQEQDGGASYVRLQIRHEESSEDDIGRRSYESDDFEFMDNNYFRGGQRFTIQVAHAPSAQAIRNNPTLARPSSSYNMVIGG